jgi:hypothetical protein
VKRSDVIGQKTNYWKMYQNWAACVNRMASWSKLAAVASPRYVDDLPLPMREKRSPI